MKKNKSKYKISKPTSRHQIFQLRIRVPQYMKNLWQQMMAMNFQAQIFPCWPILIQIVNWLYRLFNKFDQFLKLFLLGFLDFNYVQFPKHFQSRCSRHKRMNMILPSYRWLTSFAYVVKKSCPKENILIIFAQCCILSVDHASQNDFDGMLGDSTAWLFKQGCPIAIRNGLAEFIVCACTLF